MQPMSGLGAAKSGPRGPLSIGLDTSRAIGNIGRGLESHAQALISPYADTFESIWYCEGLLWRRSADGAWEATTASEELTGLRSRQTMPINPPGLLSLAFGDELTALARVFGADGKERFLYMLRLDGARRAGPGPPHCRTHTLCASPSAQAWTTARTTAGPWCGRSSRQPQRPPPPSPGPAPACRRWSCC